MDTQNNTKNTPAPKARHRHHHRNTAAPKNTQTTLTTTTRVENLPSNGEQQYQRIWNHYLEDVVPKIYVLAAIISMYSILLLLFATRYTGPGQLVAFFLTPGLYNATTKTTTQLYDNNIQNIIYIVKISITINTLYAIIYYAIALLAERLRERKLLDRPALPLLIITAQSLTLIKWIALASIIAAHANLSSLETFAVITSGFATDTGAILIMTSEIDRIYGLHINPYRSWHTILPILLISIALPTISTLSLIYILNMICINNILFEKILTYFIIIYIPYILLIATSNIYERITREVNDINIRMSIASTAGSVTTAYTTMSRYISALLYSPLPRIFMAILNSLIAIYFIYLAINEGKNIILNNILQVIIISFNLIMIFIVLIPLLLVSDPEKRLRTHFHKLYLTTTSFTIELLPVIPILLATFDLAITKIYSLAHVHTEALAVTAARSTLIQLLSYPAIMAALTAYITIAAALYYYGVSLYYIAAAYTFQELKRIVGRSVVSSADFKPSLSIYVATLFIVGTVIFLQSALLPMPTHSIKLDNSLTNNLINIVIPYIIAITLTIAFIFIIFMLLVYSRWFVPDHTLRLSPADPTHIAHITPMNSLALLALEGCPANWRCITQLALRLLAIPLLSLIVSYVITIPGYDIGKIVECITVAAGVPYVRDLKNCFNAITPTDGASGLAGIFASAVMIPSAILILSHYLRRMDTPCAGLTRLISNYLREIQLRKENRFMIIGQGLPARILAHRLAYIFQDKLHIEAPFLSTPFAGDPISSDEELPLDCSIARTLLVTDLTVLDRADERHTWCGIESNDKRYTLCYTILDRSDTHITADASEAIYKLFKERVPAYLRHGSQLAMPSVKGDARYNALWASTRPPSLLILMIPRYEETLETIRTYMNAIIAPPSVQLYSTGIDPRAKDNVLVYIMRTGTATFSAIYVNNVGGKSFYGTTYVLDHFYAYMATAEIMKHIDSKNKK